MSAAAAPAASAPAGASAPSAAALPLRERIVEAMTARRSMTLALSHASGPIASTTCFAFDRDLRVFFFVFRKSDKEDALIRTPRASIVIDEGFQIPMKGLEIVGEVTFLDGTAEVPARSALETRYPKLQNVWGHPLVHLAVLTPKRIRLIDWTTRLGFSEDLEF